MQNSFTLAALVACASALDLGSGATQDEHQSFIEYLAEQGKTYTDSSTFNFREARYVIVQKWINFHNNRPGELAHYAHNFMSDMTDEEKAKMMGITDAIKENMDLAGSDSDSGDEHYESEDSEAADYDSEDDAAAASDAGSDAEDVPADAGSDAEDDAAAASDADSDAEDATTAVQTEKKKKNKRKNRRNKNKKNKNKNNKNKNNSDSESSESEDDGPSGPVSPVSPDSDNKGNGNDVVPASSGGIDWRALGAVGPVKNQGGCGSCWAFGSNAQLEGLYQIKYGTLYDLSEQQLVDCATQGNNGCNGGFMTYVFDYYSNAAPMMLTSDYKYKGKQTSCKATTANSTAVMTKSNAKVNSKWKNSDWKEALQSGPLSIAVAAGNNYFSQYSSGILNTDKCPNSIDHAVAMVGWGVDESSGTEYWIVKNSWSTGWGENGYIRIATTGSGNGVCMAQSTGVTVSVV